MGVAGPGGAEPAVAEEQAAATAAARPGRVVHRAAWAIVAAAVVALGLLTLRQLRGDAALEAGLLDPDLVPFLLAAMALLLAGSVAALRPERGDPLRLAATAGIWTGTLLVALLVAWWLINGSARETDWVGTPVTNQAEVDRYLAANLPSRPPGSGPAVLIPTGVMIQSVEFLNANNLTVSGYVWQKYGPEVPADVAQGFVLPEAVREAYQATEAYRYTIDGVEVVGWYFAATIRQAFDYSRYPFDHQDVWLRLWHVDFERRVLLVPDFASYYNTDPASLPGVEDRFVYGGWAPLNSGFSLARNRYDSSLGLPRGTEALGEPELYFNLGLKRSFLGPFTDHIIFALAASLLLFGLLTLTTSNEDLKTRFGLSTAGVLGSVSGLFFAVILKHTQIRNNLATEQTTYLEASYYIMYGLLILVALNAVLLASPYNVPFVEYRHNLLPKLVYWPVLLGLLFGVTLAVFYGAP